MPSREERRGRGAVAARAFRGAERARVPSVAVRSPPRPVKKTRGGEVQRGREKSEDETKWAGRRTSLFVFHLEPDVEVDVAAEVHPRARARLDHAGRARSRRHARRRREICAAESDADPRRQISSFEFSPLSSYFSRTRLHAATRPRIALDSADVGHSTAAQGR